MSNFMNTQFFKNRMKEKKQQLKRKSVEFYCIKYIDIFL